MNKEIIEQMSKDVKEIKEDLATLTELIGYLIDKEES